MSKKLVTLIVSMLLVFSLNQVAFSLNEKSSLNHNKTLEHVIASNVNKPLSSELSINHNQNVNSVSGPSSTTQSSEYMSAQNGPYDLKEGSDRQKQSEPLVAIGTFVIFVAGALFFFKVISFSEECRKLP